MGSAIQLLILTCARRQEIGALRRAEVDAIEGFCAVHEGDATAI